jgi:hypothetical protein
MTDALISFPIRKPPLEEVIIDRIREGATLEEIKEYYRFLREIKADEAKVAFDADFVKLEFPEIPRLGIIDMGRGGMQRKYARWEDINEKVEPVLRSHGFRLRFDIIEENDTSLSLEAILVHRSGHSIKTRKKLPLDKSGSKNIVQAFGSTQSYAQRYSAIALLNLTSRGEDDDATSSLDGDSKLNTDQMDYIFKTVRAITGELNPDDPSPKTDEWIARIAMSVGLESIPDIPAARFDEIKIKLEKAKNQKANQ